MNAFFGRIFGRTTDTKAAQRLYQAIVDQSRQPGFYTHCGISDDPNGRFEVLALNLFLVMHRLRHEPDCRDLAQALSEQAVLDIDRNLREMGVGDLSVGRKVKQLTQSLYGRYGAYTAGLEADDETLQAALRRNLIAGSTGGGVAISPVAAYLRREAAALTRQRADALRAGNVEFGPEPGERSES